MDFNERAPFLNTAAVLEGLLVALSFGLGWFVGIFPMSTFDPSLSALARGIAGTIPLWILFAATYRFPVGPFRRMKRLLLEVLGPPLAACRWYDLVLLAILVGFSEELLFRGLLQPWFESLIGPVGSLLGTNVLFGLAHAITPFYAACTGVIGVYLGLLLEWDSKPNLMIPMVTHAAYDYVGFVVIAQSYRRQRRRSKGEDAAIGATESLSETGKDAADG